MNFSFKLKSLCRAGAAVLLAAMLTSLLSGCGVIIINRPGEGTTGEAATTAPETVAPPETSGEETNEQTEPPAVTEPPETRPAGDPIEFPDGRRDEAQKRLDALTESIDISEYNLVYAVSKDTENVIFSDEDSPLYAARSMRNDMLHNKYGVDILTLAEYSAGAETDTIYNDLETALKAGGNSSYYVDLLFLPASCAGKFLAGGLLTDMRLLPFYNATEGDTSGNIGNSRYFDLGAGSDAPEYIYALYFDRTLINDDAEKTLYSAALNSGLTFELIIGAAKTVEGRKADVISAKGPGLLGELAAPLSGINYVPANLSSTPKLALTDAEIASIDSFIEKARNLTFGIPAEDKTAEAVFGEGKIPFMLGTLGDIADLYDDPIEWGLLPLPSEQKLSAYSADRPVVCVPVTNTRHEPTSIWLTGFNAASGDWIRDEFLSVSVEKYMRDNNSCLTLFEILSRKSVLGFERLYDGYYSGLADATYAAAGAAMSKDKKFSDIYASKLSAVNKKLAKLP